MTAVFVSSAFSALTERRYSRRVARDDQRILNSARGLSFGRRVKVAVGVIV